MLKLYESISSFLSKGNPWISIVAVSMFVFSAAHDLFNLGVIGEYREAYFYVLFWFWLAMLWRFIFAPVSPIKIFRDFELRNKRESMQFWMMLNMSLIAIVAMFKTIHFVIQ